MQEEYIYIFLWGPGKLKREPPLVFWLVPTKFGCVAGRKHTVGKVRQQSFAGNRHGRPGPLDPRADSSGQSVLSAGCSHIYLASGYFILVSLVFTPQYFSLIFTSLSPVLSYVAF